MSRTEKRIADLYNYFWWVLSPFASCCWNTFEDNRFLISERKNFKIRFWHAANIDIDIHRTPDVQQQLKDNLWSPSNLMRFPSSLHVVIKHLTLLDNRKDVLSYWTGEYVEMVHSLNSLPGYGMSTTDVGASLGKFVESTLVWCRQTCFTPTSPGRIARLKKDARIG